MIKSQTFANWISAKKENVSCLEIIFFVNKRERAIY